MKTYLIAVSAVLCLAASGCSTKNVFSNNEGTGTDEMSSRSASGGMSKDGMKGGRNDGGGDMSSGERGGMSSSERGGMPGTGEPGVGSDQYGSGGSGPRGTFGGGPLSGFSKTPSDESVHGVVPGLLTPQMMAKADQQAMDRAMEGGAVRRTREDGRVELLDIYFPFDGWGLTDEGKKYLADSAHFLKDHPKAKLIIEGHCDERGSREYNLTLGEKRAREARQYLTDLGIANSVSITSYGKERPACKDHDEDCYWKNRRAHLVVQQ